MPLQFGRNRRNQRAYGPSSWCGPFHRYARTRRTFGYMGRFAIKIDGSRESHHSSDSSRGNVGRRAILRHRDIRKPISIMSDYKRKNKKEKKKKKKKNKKVALIGRKLIMYHLQIYARRLK